jgi:hypothetical protein
MQILFGMVVTKLIMIFLNNSIMKQLDWLGTSREGLLNEVAWVKLKERRTYHKLNMIYKILNNLAPSYLQELCPVQVRSITAYNLRTGEDYHVPHARTERFKKPFQFPQSNFGTLCHLTFVALTH